MTYRALGDATQQHPETVRRYMQGQSPSVEFLSALCFRFDINAQWLLTGQGPVRHTEARAHALREANPAELLAAVAAALERLTDRVDRIDLFIQTLETRLRASLKADQPSSGELVEPKSRTVRPGASDPPSRGAAVADALSQRSHPDAD